MPESRDELGYLDLRYTFAELLHFIGAIYYPRVWRPRRLGPLGFGSASGADHKMDGMCVLKVNGREEMRRCNKVDEWQVDRRCSRREQVIGAYGYNTWTNKHLLKIAAALIRQSRDKEQSGLTKATIDRYPNTEKESIAKERDPSTDCRSKRGIKKIVPAAWHGS
jgi:hypothetical protein